MEYLAMCTLRGREERDTSIISAVHDIVKRIVNTTAKLGPNIGFGH